MEPWCVRQNLIPGTSKLFDDFLYNFDRVSRFYPLHFADPSAFRLAASHIEYPAERRQMLVNALREQNGPSAALDELARPDTVAVVTGQQVGLISGPSYTIFKALTAVKLAAHLRTEGINAVPIFWLASEDHDLAEVDHAWVFNQDAKPQKISVSGTVSGGGPVGDIVLNEMPFGALREALGDLPFAGEVLDRLERAYRPGNTLACAFKEFLQDLLKGFGLLFIDPLAPAVREMAAPFLADAAQRVPELLDALRQRNSELSEAGYHTQVFLDEGTSLLFLLTDGKRLPLRWQDGQFLSRDKTYSVSELQALSSQLSPNALLRPVMQDYLLPTITYVGGPAEIAYMAQGEVLYQRLLGRMPVIFPRNTFTLLDSRGQKLLDRYALKFTDLLDHQEKVKSRMAERLVPPGLISEFSGFEASASKALIELKGKLRDFDPTLEAAAGKSTSKILFQLHKLVEKTGREALRRNERSTCEANYLITLVYPHRRLQERFYSIVPFLAKHGLDLPQRILEMTQVACPDHMIRTL